MSVEYDDNFVLVKGEITEFTRQYVINAAVFLVGEIKLALGTGQRTGKVYRVPGTKTREYTSSSEGEAPAVMLASLITSISYEITEDNAEEVIARVGTNIEYAARLEFGYTDTDSMGREYNMAPRPYMRPTYLKNREKIRAILGGATP